MKDSREKTQEKSSNMCLVHTTTNLSFKAVFSLSSLQRYFLAREFHIQGQSNDRYTVVAMSDADWSEVIFKCTAENVARVLLEFYDFVVDLEGVKSLHFIIRDRVKNEVVFSFRVLTEKRFKEIVRSKMNYKLGTLVPDKFAVDPDKDSSLRKYAAWSTVDRISKLRLDKFSEFRDILSKMSGLAIQMLRNGYFSSAERVEVAHVMSWMLGCTEYGLMSPTHWEVGYYDRIEDKACPYLKQDFPKTEKTGT